MVPEDEKYLAERHIPFEYIDYDLADETTQDRIIRELDAAGASSFPFVKIGNHIVEGYRPDRYAELLGLAETGDQYGTQKQALRFFYTKAVEPLGFKFTPDAELAEYLLDQKSRLRPGTASRSVPAGRFAVTVRATCRSSVPAFRFIGGISTP